MPTFLIKHLEHVNHVEHIKHTPKQFIKLPTTLFLPIHSHLRSISLFRSFGPLPESGPCRLTYPYDVHHPSLCVLPCDVSTHATIILSLSLPTLPRRNLVSSDQCIANSTRPAAIITVGVVRGTTDHQLTRGRASSEALMQHAITPNLDTQALHHAAFPLPSPPLPFLGLSSPLKACLSSRQDRHKPVPKKTLTSVVRFYGARTASRCLSHGRRRP